MWYKLAIFTLLGSLTACSMTNSNEETNKTTAAKINVRLGMAYLERHDMSRAKQKFLLALEEAPNIPEPWYSMGYYMESTDNINSAQTYYLKAVRIAPHRGDVLNNYGTFLCRTGDYRGAIKHFLLAIQDPKYLDPSSAYENAGLCALKIPNQNTAARFFRKALAEDPSRTTALIKLAEINYSQHDYASARVKLAEYLAIAEPNAQTYLLEQKLDSVNSVR